MGASVVSNPPYNLPWEPPALAKLLPQYENGVVPPKSNANYAFILSALALADQKCALLLPTCVLQPSTREEQAILKQLVDFNVVAAAIALPGQMFESTSIPTCVLLFDHKKETRKIELIDLANWADQETREQRGQFGGASHTGRVYKKTLNVLSADVMRRALHAVQNSTDEEGFSVAVSIETVAENGYCLAPKRYLTQEFSAAPSRSFEDIAADYNRIVRHKNAIQIKMNETAARRLGFDCMNVETPDLTESFAVVGQTCEKEKHVSFTKSDGIVISCSTKEGIPDLIVSFLHNWKFLIMALNNEENRLLAEFRDALLPKLMSGEIELEPKEN